MTVAQKRLESGKRLPSDIELLHHENDMKLLEHE